MEVRLILRPTVAVGATVEELSGKSSHTLGIVGNSLGSVFPLKNPAFTLTLHHSVPFPCSPQIIFTSPSPFWGVRPPIYIPFSSFARSVVDRQHPVSPLRPRLPPLPITPFKGGPGDMPLPKSLQVRKWPHRALPKYSSFFHPWS